MPSPRRDTFLHIGYEYRRHDEDIGGKLEILTGDAIAIQRHPEPFEASAIIKCPPPWEGILWRERAPDVLEMSLWILGDGDPQLRVPLGTRSTPAECYRRQGPTCNIFFVIDLAERLQLYVWLEKYYYEEGVSPVHYLSLHVAEPGLMLMPDSHEDPLGVLQRWARPRISWARVRRALLRRSIVIYWLYLTQDLMQSGGVAFERDREAYSAEFGSFGIPETCNGLIA
jgi:hypothetical protein